MSFTIKCNMCGGEQIFTSDSRRWGDNIEIDVEYSNTYTGASINSIDIYCENMDCPSQIEIKYDK